MSKFLKIEVVRRESTEVYIEVPDDWDITKRPPRELVKAATVETTASVDWDNYGWESDLDVNSRALVPEKEAKQFKFFTLEQTQPFLKPPARQPAAIPAALYIVRYYTPGSFTRRLLQSELPAMALDQARQEAQQRANQFKVVVTIEGIGSEIGFKEEVKPQ